MLLAEDVRELLPEWAFFVRCVINAGELRPTASREALYEDDLLAETREVLGTQIKDWLVRLAATSPDRLQRFLAVHHLGVKAMATHDLEMLRIVDQWWPLADPGLAGLSVQSLYGHALLQGHHPLRAEAAS
jgi:molecular chaperone HtpG